MRQIVKIGMFNQVMVNEEFTLVVPQDGTIVYFDKHQGRLTFAWFLTENPTNTAMKRFLFTIDNQPVENHWHYAESLRLDNDTLMHLWVHSSDYLDLS